jgi:hypothetical protein
MIDPGIVAPLAIAAVIAVVIVVFIHRASTTLAAQRRDERERNDALALWERADAALRILEDRARSLRDAIEAVPAAERGGERAKPPHARSPMPGAVHQALVAFDGAVEDLRRVATDVARAGAAPGTRGLAPELDRARAAADALRTGFAADAWGDEGRRAVKHGYIEIVHAREAAVARLAELSGSTGPADPRAA